MSLNRDAGPGRYWPGSQIVWKEKEGNFGLHHEARILFFSMYLAGNTVIKYNCKVDLLSSNIKNHC